MFTDSWKLASCAVITVVAGVFLGRKRDKHLPPGPPKLPWIDNLLNMPAGSDWVKWAEIGKQHNSDIIHLSALGTSLVILNSYQAARDLLEQRSNIYSSRNVGTMTQELCPMDTLFVMTPYNDIWRRSRRMFTKHFAVGNTVISRPRDVFYIRRFLAQLLENPKDFRQHLNGLLSGISISMTYGVRPLSQNDPYARISDISMEATVGVLSKAPWMVDLIPVLKYLPSWFPGTNFLQVAADCTRKMNEARNMLFEAGTSALATRDHCPSFLSEALQELEGIPQAEAEDQRVLVKNIAGMVYFAAFDTTRSTLATFFLAMTCYPDVQAKLRQKLDEVLKGRLPEHDDVERIPYLTATVMEVLRRVATYRLLFPWKPALPAGVPHLVIVDDTYRRYHIPKNSIIIANQWAMLQDPTDYPDPSEFRPERFLDKDGNINGSVLDPTNIAFGFGRRICPGRHIALSTIKLTVASVLSLFEIQKALDENGTPIEPTREYVHGVILQPKDFPCEIKPRSEMVKDVINTWVKLEGGSPP